MPETAEVIKYNLSWPGEGPTKNYHLNQEPNDFFSRKISLLRTSLDHTHFALFWVISIWAHSRFVFDDSNYLKLKLNVSFVIVSNYSHSDTYSNTIISNYSNPNTISSDNLNIIISNDSHLNTYSNISFD